MHFQREERGICIGAPRWRAVVRISHSSIGPRGGHRGRSDRQPAAWALRNRALGVSAFVAQGYSARRRIPSFQNNARFIAGKRDARLRLIDFSACRHLYFAARGIRIPAYRAHYWSFK
jgi:hypothetical protein